jgi:cell division septation protein DedD
VAAFKAADEAQPIIRTLRDGGMPVIAKTFPDGLAHVLVGPFADARALSNAKQELTTRFGIKQVYPRQLPLK